MPARRGVSLIELSTVIATMAVIAAIGVPRYGRSLAHSRATQAAARIKADVNFARWRAKAGSAGQTVVYSTASATYTLPGVPGLNGGAATYAVSLAGEPYLASVVSTTFAGSTLTFDRFGRPAAGGVVTIRSGDATQTVTVDAVTGQASVP